MPAPIRVLFAASEVHPWSKTGGLGDVAAALPAALRQEGVDAQLLIPGYPTVLSQCRDSGDEIPVPALAALPAAHLQRSTTAYGDVPVWIIRCPELYERGGGPYLDPLGRDWPDNYLRFGQLSRIAAWLASPQGPAEWRPQILHCNDWQAALAAAYCRWTIPSPGVAVIITIHNLAFQGVFPAERLPALGLPWESFRVEGLEFHGSLSFLKGGLYYADWITTVSPTYAREICLPHNGAGLDGLLASRADKLSGILNGIDEETWDPARDPLITEPYNAESLGLKAVNKTAVQLAMGLYPSAHTLLCGIVSRITHQKGLDLVADVLSEMLDLPLQVAIVGMGDTALEARFRQVASAYPGRVALDVSYSEPLAHQVEAGADLFLMPSRFEPCGLNQMYSQRYGTIPLVHDTGGLHDSVVDANPSTLAAGTATGLCFSPFSGPAFLSALGRGLDLYKNRQTWGQLQRAGMARDFSWKPGARAYAELYRRLLPP